MFTRLLSRAIAERRLGSVTVMEDVSTQLENAARTTSLQGIRRYTRFLDPAQAQEAARLARRYGVELSLWGGYPDAERTVACFSAQEDAPQRAEFPVICLHARYTQRFLTITHRDLLGAFMALGLTRDTVGDIILSDADIFLFAAAATAEFIAGALTSAGRASLHFEILDEIPSMPSPRGETFHAVISSLRLDAVLAAAYRLSRSEAAEAIRAGGVKLDHLPCERTDAPVAEGALLSLRGRGRVRLQVVGGTTRKQRIGVTFFRYE